MTRLRRWTQSSCVLVALALPFSAMAQETRLGNEFQVNIYSTNSQRYPSVAAEANGDFVVAWESAGQDGSGYGVFGRRFSSAGTPLASEFQVNTHTPENQQYPSAAADADGDFVIAWQSYGQDGSGYSTFARRFSSAGAALATEFQVNTYSTGSQYYPSVAAAAGGGFVVAWQSLGQDGSSIGVFARRFSSEGASLANEFQVNTQTADVQSRPSVAEDADGDIIVAWHSFAQDGAQGGVFARRFSSAGTALATEFQVNSLTLNVQTLPSVAAGAGGDFVVAWQSAFQDGQNYGVFARRFSSAGAPLASEFQVNTYTESYQHLPSVAANADGELVISWTSAHDAIGVFARRFSKAGAPLGTEFQVNAFTSSTQLDSSVAVADSGAFVVAWRSFNQDGSDFGVFAQRFAAVITLDVDGNGSADPLTDGLLALRYLFGFRGATLITGAVSGGCTRCDAPSIEAYLANLT